MAANTAMNTRNSTVASLTGWWASVAGIGTRKRKGASGTGQGGRGGTGWRPP